MDVDVVDWLQTNGIGIVIILAAPLFIMFGYIGISFASTFVSTPLTHVSTQAYCAEIPTGVYTIFPAYLTLLSIGGNGAYSSLFLLSACIGSSVEWLSLVLWYFEIMPIAVIAEIVRQRFAY